MKIFQNTDFAGNVASNVSVNTATTANQPVQKQQLDEANSAAVKLGSTVISYANGQNFEKTDLTVEILSATSLTSDDQLTSQSQHNDMFFTSVSDDLKTITSIVNGKRIELQMSQGVTVKSILSIGESTLIYSTTSNSVDSTVCIDLLTDTAITLPTSIPDDAWYDFKYLAAINKVAMFRPFLAKVILVEFVDNFRFVANVKEIAISAAFNKLLIDANNTGIVTIHGGTTTHSVAVFNYNKALNTFTKNTSAESTISTFYSGKRLHDLNYSNGKLFVFGETVTATINAMTKIDSNFTVSNVEDFEILSTLGAATAVKSYNVLKSLVLIKIKGTAQQQYEHILFSTSNNKIIKTVQDANAYFHAFSGYLTDAGTFTDYDFNLTNGKFPVMVKSAGKAMIFGERELQSNDVLTYAELISILEDVDIVIDDSSFFVKVNADAILTSSLVSSEVNGLLRIALSQQAQNNLTNKKFVDAWAKVTSASSVNYLPVKLTKSGSVLYAQDITGGNFANHSSSTISLAAKLETVSSEVDTIVSFKPANDQARLVIVADSFDFDVNLEIEDIKLAIDDEKYLPVTVVNDMIEANNELNNGAKLIVKASQTNIEAIGCTVFTNAGQDTQVASNKIGSRNVILVTSGDTNAMTNSTSDNSQTMFMEDGSVTNIHNQGRAAIISALKVLSIMNRTNLSDVQQVLDWIIQVNTFTENIGYGVIDNYDIAERISTYGESKAFNKKQTTPQNITNYDNFDLMHKNAIIGAATNSPMMVVNYSAVTLQPVEENVFVEGGKYVIEDDAGGTFTNVGFQAKGKVFKATSTTATNFPLAAKVFMVEGGLSIITHANVREYVDGFEETIDFSTTTSTAVMLVNATVINAYQIGGLDFTFDSSFNRLFISMNDGQEATSMIILQTAQTADSIDIEYKLLPVIPD